MTLVLLLLSQANRIFFTYFGMLCYIANFKGAELQFSQILISVHEKLLRDLQKYETVNLKFIHWTVFG